MGGTPWFGWISGNERLLGWLAATSVVMFVATLIAVPWLLTLVPADYFTPAGRERRAKKDRHPVIHCLIAVGKNLLGLVFLLAGILMLILPGQGILTILAGVMFMDFPGKRRLEYWIVSRPVVRRSIDWLRQRQGHPPLDLEG